MASESTKLQPLKAILAKNSAACAASGKVVSPLSQRATNSSDSVGTSLVQGDRTGGLQNSESIGSGLPPTGSGNENDLSTQQTTMHELPNAKQDSGLSKLDRLKAILEESKRKKAANLQGVPPASLPDTSHEKALPNSTAPAAGNSCDGTGAVHSSGPTSSEQTSEKAKKLKELLERKAQKRVTVQQLLSSPTPPALERVSNNDRKGGETSPTGPSSSEPHSKKDGNDKGVSRFPHSRLPLGMRVPVVIIRLEEDEKLIYLQEVSALRDLVKMVKALNAVVSLEKQIEEPVPGDLVAVLHKKDSTWYRGQIGLVKHNEKDAASGDRHRSKEKVRVWFMDYGRWEDVSLDSLRHLPNGYERLPGFAIPVTLHGLKKIMVPKDFKFEASFFDAEVVTNSDQQSIRLHNRNDDICLNDMLAVYAECTGDASAS